MKMNSHPYLIKASLLTLATIFYLMKDKTIKSGDD